MKSKSMKVLVTLVVLLSFAYTSSWSQDVPSPVATTIEQVSDVDPRFVVETIDRKNSFLAMDPFLNQFGAIHAGNAAQIVQRGDENITILEQYGGIGNVASISLFGQDNEVTATQNGSNNRLGLAVDGSSNIVPVTQIGTGHELSLEITGNDVMLDKQVYYLEDGATLNSLPRGIVQEGTGSIPLYIRIDRGN
jgi:hypothetical protein